MRFFNLPTYSNTPGGTESIPSSDANNTDRRFTLSGLAKWIVESFTGSTLGGSEQSPKDAIDAATTAASTADAKNWTTATALTNEYSIAFITASLARRLISVANVAKHIIETYAGSSLAGSTQSVKSAIDTINTNVGALQVTVTSLTNGSTTTITLKRGGRYIAIISRANTTVAAYGGLYLIQAHDSGYIREIASSSAASLSISGTTLSASASTTYVGLTLICLNN